ncbi:MAG: ribbon-helix-helix domain-containing protein [Candidatus Heimdallarchaeota archaeon]
MHLPEYYINGLLELVVQKKWPNRSEIIRAAIRDLLKKELKGFSVNADEPKRTHNCSKCETPLYLAKDEGVYFCARCKSFFTREFI